MNKNKPSTTFIFKNNKVALPNTTFKFFKSGAGFTLIEILIVIAVIGIISAISMSVYVNMRPNLNLSSEIRDTVTDLRYAQQLAVTEQVIYAVNFNIVLNQYTITNTNSGQIIKTKNINSPISIQSVNDLTDNTVNFNVAGAAIETGTIVLTNNELTSTIEIKPSGYVKIQ